MAKITQPKKQAEEKRKKTVFKRTTKRRVARKKVPNEKYGTSKLETYFAKNFLDKLGLKYIYEYEAKDIGRFYDFAIVATIPNTNIIMEEKNDITAISQNRNTTRVQFMIEVDGNHWHPDQEKSDWEKLSPIQKHNLLVDRLKNEWCAKHKIPLLRIWESDIRKYPKKVMGMIEETIDNLDKLDRIKIDKNRPHLKKK